MVDPAQIFDVAIWQPARQISRAVHLTEACTFTREWITYELLGCQLRTVQIAARHTDAANAQLPGYANRLQLLGSFLDDVQTNVLNRLPDRNDSI